MPLLNKNGKPRPRKETPMPVLRAVARGRITEIWELYRAGHSLEQLAEAYGVAVITIRRNIRKGVRAHLARNPDALNEHVAAWVADAFNTAEHFHELLQKIDDLGELKEIDLGAVTQILGECRNIIAIGAAVRQASPNGAGNPVQHESNAGLLSEGSGGSESSRGYVDAAVVVSETAGD